MNKDNEFRNKWRGPLLLSFVALLILCGAVKYCFMDFNNKEVIVSGNTINSKVNITMDTQSTKGERWESDLQMSNDKENLVTITGETINGSILNGSDYKIKNWSLTVCFQNECYLNGFWGGSMEVHQFRDGVEKIETIPEIVNNAQIKELEVNPYVDFMMIRLMPGDYFVFTPTKEENGNLIKAGEKAGIVFNLYYIDPLDFSDYELAYYNDVQIRETWIYPFIIGVWLVWLALLLTYHTVLWVDRKILHDLNNSVQSISVMADLYLETYMINPEKKTAYRIKGEEEKSLLHFDNKELQKSLDQYVEEDCQDAYVEDFKKFLDMSTLAERITETASIVFEYRSKKIGWCSIRIFKLNQKKEAVQFVLAIQDINEERKRLHEIEEHVRQNENNVIIQGDFLNNTFFAMNELVNVIRSVSEGLVATIPDINQKMMAQSINDSIEHLHLLKNCVHDLFSMNSNTFELKSEIYNVRDMAEKLKSILTPFYMGKDYEFQLDIDKNIPEKIRGDKERIMQILVVLLFSSMFVTQKGFVKLSVFGKQVDKKEELIFSVKDSAMGFTEEQVMEIQEVFRASQLKPLENASLVYLQIMNQILLRMNSEMKLVSVFGSGSEFYFSLEQEVVSE